MKNYFIKLYTLLFLLFWISYSIKAATYTVTNLNDGGAGSLRQAIADANGNAANAPHTIDMTGITGVINLNSQIDISTGMTILGSGRDNLRVRRSTETGIIFDIIIAQAVSVNFKHLTMSHATTSVHLDISPTVVNSPSVLIDDCIVEENGGNTAAIYWNLYWNLGTLNASSLVITNSILRNNRNTYQLGGALYMRTRNNSNFSYRIENCIIERNEDRFFGGAFYIFCKKGVINNCVFKYNKVQGPSSGPARGGAIRMTGDGIHTINNSTFTQNSTTNVGIGTIAISSGVDLTLNHCTIYDNTAGKGGAIINQTTVPVKINHCIILGNTATADDSENLFGAFSSDNGHNVLGITTGGTLTGTTTGNVTNAIPTDVINTTLQTIGGNPLEVFTLTPTSVAKDLCVDAILSTDQLGVARDNRPDAGAYESPNPEINLQGNSNDIVSGTTSTSLTNDTDFGAILECGTNTISKTYTIQNTGTADLTVNTITITGVDATDFTLSGLPTFPSTIAAGANQTFTVTFDPSATGNRTATITIANNDSNENPYTFAINGNGTADNIDPLIPTLTNVTAQCSVASIPAPTTTDNCSGTITGTTAQTFPITAQGTTIVTWTFTDASGNSVTANQNVIITDTTNPTITAPTNITTTTDTGLCTASGIALGTPTGTDNCGTVTFSNNAPATFPIGITTVTWTANDGNGNTQTATQTVSVSDSKEINVLGNALSITNGDTDPDVSDNTNFGNTALAKTITYTIQNLGTKDLTIASILSSGTHAANFVVSNFTTNTTVAAGNTTTFDVTFTPSTTGTQTATITINNNDCDEGTYNFAIQGSTISSGDVFLVETGIFYPTIQQAVDAAVAGNTIKPTANRNYPENVVVNKNLTFTSDFTDYKNVTINQIKVNNGNKLTITGDMSIVEILHLEPTGQIEITGTDTDFALLSTANKTALVINDSPTNTVVGNVIMERHLPDLDDLGGTNGLGYHLFSSPFSDATVAQFGDNMNLVLNTDYNTASEPAFTRPFPTFFEYQETNAGTTTSAYYNRFISNYKVPTTPNLTPTKGYQANIATGVTVDLKGTLNNGNQSIALTNSGGGFGQEGYNLIGNPYPSPIDWELVLAASTGVEDAIYIDIPVNQYQGIFAEYVNGVSNNGGKKEIAAMQGFFVRTTTGGTVNMNNSVRLATDTRFYKTTETQNLKEGLIKIALQKGNYTDETTIYFEKGATPNFDSNYDAAKLHKMNNQRATVYSYNENTKTAQNEYFAINGLGSFDSEQKLPLAMNILADGEYQITLRSMKYFHSKHELYLYDSLTDSLHNLRTEGDYTFQAKKGNEIKRFVLIFKTDANQDFFTNEKVIVYPNPTPNQFSYSLKTNRKGNHTIRLFDATGRIIVEEIKTKEGAFLEGTINLEKHAAGLYLLQIIDSEKTMTVRILKE